MFLSNRVRVAALGLSSGLVVSACASAAEDVDEEPLGEEATVEDALTAAPEEPEEGDVELADDDVQFYGGAYRGGTHRGGAYRGGAYRGGAYRGGAYRGGAYRGGAYRGGAVYGAGGVYRAGRYMRGGVWVTCDAYGNCW